MSELLLNQDFGVQNIADKDNPLIDRLSQQEWEELRQQTAQKNQINHHLFASFLFTPPKQIVSFGRYDIADFGDLSMTDDEDIVENQAFDDVSQADNTDNLLMNNPQTVQQTPMQMPVQDVVNDKQKPIIKKAKKSQSLSKLEQFKLKRQNKQQLAEEIAKKQAEEEAERQAKIAYALANPTIHESLLNQKKSMIDEKPLVQDTFSELQKDLQVIVLPEHLSGAVQKAYEQAVQIVQHFDNPNVTEEHRIKAKAIIQKVAQANVSDAMLRQALWLLRGDSDFGVAKNSEEGLKLVQQSAKLEDSRAEKLLSKLYFSGELVGVNTEQGKYWLMQSALHGHAEAQKLQQAFVMTDTLKQTRADDDDYLKKMAIGTAVLVLVALIIIFAVKI
ncbi:tetratricopeptide repeat protein [Faucicola mancuniensis]|uniref:tetratricopeptide repeat protein n=1 Tax=Faucicola mancuniensis TaxID=1309795 RepID=UPI00397763F3